MLTRRNLLSSAAGAAAISALPAFAAPDGADAAARAVLDDITEEMIRTSPETATYLGRDIGALAPLRSQLSDRSAKGVAETVARLQRATARLKALRRDTLSPAVSNDVRVVEAAFTTALEGFGFGYGDVAIGGYRNSPFVVIQNVGAFIDVPLFLDNEHPLKTAADADAYVARLDAYPRELDGETARLAADRAKGVVAPDFLVDKTIAALKLSLAGPPGEWQVIAPLAAKAASIPGNAVTRAGRIAERAIGPALERQIAELQRHRLKADGRAGVWKQPRGDEYYAWALAAGTTTKMSPAEVHQMGLDQMRDLQGQMAPILAGLGYTKGTVGERLQGIAKDPRFTFPDTDAGRAEILAVMQRSVDKMARLTPRLFATQVKSNVVVRRQLLAQEIGGAGAYGGPGTPDGRVSPTVWVNLRTPSTWSRFSLPDLAYHEGIPGHGWQGQYNFRLPLIRTMLAFNAYKEGWALYGEQLADELGVYSDSPVDRLGYLQSLAFRAGRLVVDTGLHAKRWTRDQAIRWFAENNGEARGDEVDRYCAWPGQACGYKVGHTHIVGLRERAKTALGDRFDLRLFNDALVGGGEMPLSVLDGVVAEHIRLRKA